VRGYALVAVAACAWGTWPLILKHAPMAPSLQSAVVMAVLTIVSLPLMLRDRVNARASRGQWLGVAWLGVSDAGNIALFFAAYQRTSVAIAVLTHYLTPIFVALAGPIVLRERATRRTMIAVAVAFTGLVMLLEPWRARVDSRDVVGAALGAGSAAFYASNVLTAKRLAPVFSASELMFFHGLVGTPLLFLLVPAGAYAGVAPGPLAVILLAALGPGATAGLMFVSGLRRVPANHASILALLEPLVAVVLAAFVLRERLGVAPIFGGGLILGGAVAVVTDSGAPAAQR
jgi:drug/metabolite transporter (DMT)-like permease